MDFNREFTNAPGSMNPRNKNYIPNAEGPRQLTADEIQVWNNCLKEGFLKFSIPLAVVMHLLSTYVVKKDTSNITPGELKFSGRSIMRFAGSCFLGLLCYSPICFSKLQQKFFENERKLKQMKQENILSNQAESENELSSGSSSDDFHMQSSLDPKMDGPAGSFSHLNIDFNQTFGDTINQYSDADSHTQEKEKETKPVERSYDDLRKQNRENFKKNFVLSSVHPYPQSSQNNRPQPVAEKPLPAKPKNKYGDEME